MNAPEKLEQVMVRMPPALHEAVKARAERDDRSMAATIRHAVRLYLDDRYEPGRVADTALAALEEAGYTIGRLERVGTFYESDGEYFLTDMYPDYDGENDAAPVFRLEPSTMSVEDAAQWIIDRHRAEWGHEPDDDPEGLWPWTVDELLTDPGALAQAFRDLSKRLHPDAGGSAEDFAQLDECRRLIEA